MTNTTSLGKLGKYDLLEKIGEGGFGIVYRALDPLLQRDVAIKVLRSDLASAPDFVERFQREARLAAGLHHPNIVTVYEIGEQEGHYYIVMEHLLGPSLSELLEQGKPLLLAQVLKILRPLAQALDHAHSQGVIHRDIKPSNIILVSEERPVLTDFGLVKSMTEQGTTTTGITLGTPEYMAPEQITGQKISPASDLYALGVIAYQMLTGRVPFTGRTPFEIQMGHVQQAPPPPRSLNPAMPEALAQVLLRALAKNPLQRYQTGAELVAALEQFLLRSTPPPAAPRRVTQPTPVTSAPAPSIQPRMTPVEQPTKLPMPVAKSGGGQINTNGTYLALGIGFTITLIISIAILIASLGILIVDAAIAFIVLGLMTILVARRVRRRQRIPWLAILLFWPGLEIFYFMGFSLGMMAFVGLGQGGIDAMLYWILVILAFGLPWLIGGAILILGTILWRRTK